MKFDIEKIREVARLVKELAVGLGDLNFADNFRSFEKDVTIPATSEARIVNELSFIPTKYIITSQTGDGLVTKGDTAWTDDLLYLKNNGSVSVTLTVVFLK